MNAGQYRWCELLLVFFCLPILAYFFRFYLSNWLFPALIILMAVCTFLLLTDPHFKRFRLTSLGQFSTVKKRIFTSFFAGALFSAMLYGLLNQENWFSFPLDSTRQWLILLIAYPLLSVLPQELIFRSYFFHRYKKILPNKTARIILSASVFALAHCVYDNWIAIGLSFGGGLLFAYTYAHSRSLLVCVLEHSLWGLWVFTLGVGEYLDSGLTF
ncbi:CPBP family intramembrane glutamic endopeptidase [Pseudoalteromonas aurantia]|uniref:CPBP family intramembrane metalloprotease n=1 Tax=Pseudoalteromonas aurantia TaxID=43654 RepID=A0A5S3V947_9GAMM|nr:CPBP family intramembrane glutamic endopeptidase [Pseudoalteromonas aurantia]TMO65415.1 CPBP family intramembrane metalloprotease [Pseudoalteromonas aurantia]TMO67896.1 CPBP family intramembrane metalloprotease [Pseudoalteromonas aurantia]TMO71733.1 CPBP family intramembrane metalloprotease [Pseudoalteromonas aurantia]